MAKNCKTNQKTYTIPENEEERAMTVLTSMCLQNPCPPLLESKPSEHLSIQLQETVLGALISSDSMKNRGGSYGESQFCRKWNVSHP